MDPVTYSLKRDELINILRKVTEIKGLDPVKRAEFELIRKKCLEDQFNIVLVGEFQGGKSTSFNTFCDGREISPRGALVKTSACRITARNLADPGAREYARVYWKNNKDLVLNIEDILTRHIDMKEDLGMAFKPGDEILGLSDILSFSNKVHLALIEAAISGEWKSYEQNRGAYSPDSLDILRIATLIIRFANDEGIRKARDREEYSIEEIAQLIVFPSDWEGRWGTGSNAAFALQDVFFAFIGSIDCYIHSPNLARLGCSITDCPGLFASKWDTQVAINTIPRSDAIIYLLRGDRGIGSEETKALREIQKMPAAHKKLFYAINMRALRHVIDHSIVPHDVAALKAIGFSVEDRDINRYHALLAFLAEFGTGYLDNTLGGASKRIFTGMAKRMLGVEESPDVAWSLLANQQLQTLSIPAVCVPGLDKEAVKKVRDSSGAVELFNAVEGFVIKNKAYSILMTNGAEKAGFALAEIENSLKNREAEATGDVQKRTLELEEARNKLNRFQDDAKKIVSEAFEDKVYEILVTNFFEEVILSSTEEISLKIAYRLGRKLTAKVGMQMLINKIPFMGADESDEQMMQISRPIYQDVMQEVIGNRAKVWLISVSKNENEAYMNSVPVESKRVIALLEKKWQELAGIQINIPRIEYPNISEVFERLIKETANGIDTPETLNSFYQIAKGELIGSIIRYVISAPRLLFNWAWGELKELFGSSSERRHPEATPVEKEPFTEQDLDFKGRQLYPNIRNGIMRSYSSKENFRDVRAKILDLLRRIGEEFKKVCRNALEVQKGKFEKDFKVSEDNLKQSAEDRMKVANEARTLREEHIEPRTREITAFAASIVHSGINHEG